MTADIASKLSTPTARRFVRLALTVGIGIPVALGPLLGTKSVPLFEPLVSVLSRDLRGVVIPFSIVMVTIVALALEFYVRERIDGGALHWLFAGCALSLLVAIAWLFSLQTSYLLRVPIESGRRELWVVITAKRLPAPRCPCGDVGNLACVKRLSVDPTQLELCWDEVELQRNRQRLAASYLLTMFLLTTLVGIVVLRLGGPPGAGKRPRRKRKRARPGADAGKPARRTAKGNGQADG